MDKEVLADFHFLARYLKEAGKLDDFDEYIKT